LKTITICGSLRFTSELKTQAERLALEGNCVLTPIFPQKEKSEYSSEEIDVLNMGQLQKIDLSDVVFIVNKDGYIGESVAEEILYAKIKHKEIIYLENPVGEES